MASDTLPDCCMVSQSSRNASTHPFGDASHRKAKLFSDCFAISCGQLHLAVHPVNARKSLGQHFASFSKMSVDIIRGCPCRSKVCLVQDPAVTDHSSSPTKFRLRAAESSRGGIRPNPKTQGCSLEWSRQILLLSS